MLVLHAFDEAVVNRRPGTQVSDNWSLLALAAAGAAIAAVYPRLPALLRAALVFAFAPLAGAGAAMHVQGAVWNGAGGADFSGFLLILATIAFVAAAVIALLARPGSRSRGRRIARWALTALGAVVLVVWVAVPVAVAVVLTQKPPEPIPDERAFGPEVTFRTSDGLDLRGWFRRSDGPGIVIAHGGGGDRMGSLPHAEMLADEGFSVLVYDSRGRGESEGKHNAVGWLWPRDIDAAVAFMRERVGGRVGVVGLSTGADAALLAAEDNPDIGGVVSDGSTIASLSDVWDVSRSELPYWVTAYGLVAALDGSAMPKGLEDAARGLRGRPVLFVSTADGLEADANRVWARAYGAEDALWLVDARHTQAVTDRPAEYRRRVTAFFRRALVR